MASSRQSFRIPQLRGVDWPVFDFRADAIDASSKPQENPTKPIQLQQTEPLTQCKVVYEGVNLGAWNDLARDHERGVIETIKVGSTERTHWEMAWGGPGHSRRKDRGHPMAAGKWPSTGERSTRACAGVVA